MADIGSHWFDLAEHVTGLRVSSLCADLKTFHPTRKQPKRSVETFANKLLGAEDYIETAVETEDFGAVIFRMGDRARGAMTASQVSAGRKNRFNIEIYGTKSGGVGSGTARRTMDRPPRHRQLRSSSKTRRCSSPTARGYADLPGGHSEGYDDTFKQIFRVSTLRSAIPRRARVSAVCRRPAPARDPSCRAREPSECERGLMFRSLKIRPI
jgi:predicted dehydrogenase